MWLKVGINQGGGLNEICGLMIFYWMNAIQRKDIFNGVG